MKFRAHRRIWLSGVVALALLAGCAGEATPNPDGPRLLGFDNLPKALATVEFSPTPSLPATLDVPTATYAPPTRTPTATPYVGIFMGNLTPLAGTIAYIPQGTRAPVVGPSGAIGGAPVSVPLQPPSTGAPLPIPIVPTVNANVPITPCAQPPASEFNSATNNPAVRARLGCPSAPATQITIVAQPFEKGLMFWRDTREIFALSTSAVQSAQVDIYWRFQDTWNESLPALDPSIVPPANLQQPVRGFGYVWRSNPVVRERLGWALAGEQPLQAVFQTFERGWMLTGPNGAVFAFAPNPDQATGVHFGALSQ